MRISKILNMKLKTQNQNHRPTRDKKAGPCMMFLKHLTWIALVPSVGDTPAPCSVRVQPSGLWPEEQDVSSGGKA